MKSGSTKGIGDGTPEESERLAGLGKPPAPRVPHSAFRSTNFFMLVFLSAWVVQGVFFTYFVSVITTIEKLFHIQSKTTGSLLAATEIGQICTSLFLTYYAGRGHRPRWIACSMLVLALGVLGCVVPHVLYGTQLVNVHMEVHNSSAEALCLAGAGGEGGAGARCGAGLMRGQEAHSSITAVVLPWFFVSLLVVGVGQTGVATLGIPYIDDNVKSAHSPVYMAITIGTRVIGPAMGFVLGAFCTRLYVNPLETPDFNPGDPRWLGAWWLGMVLVAVMVVTLALIMFCFPRQIRASPEHSAIVVIHDKYGKENKSIQAVLADFWATIKRQLTNDILMFRTASSVLHIMPISGLYSFLPKYLEIHFKLPTHDANLVSGLGGIAVMGVGILLSGVVILKFVPTARQVAGWLAATAFIYSAGMVALMFVSCPVEQFAGMGEVAAGVEGIQLHTPIVSNTLPEHLACRATCSCDNSNFQPICGQDGMTYFSACHAGCRNVNKTVGRLHYSNCECIDKNTTTRENTYFRSESPTTVTLSKSGGPASLLWGEAREGYCHGSCDNFRWFVSIFALLVFIHSTGEVGAVLLIIRCTDPKDKAMAMGVIQFAIGLFGNVPCPIIFGSAVDSACLIWDSICNTKGACFHYDTDQFRHFFLGLTAGIMFLAFIMDLFVLSKAGRIDINPGEGAVEGAEEDNDPTCQSLTALPPTPPHVDTQV